MHNAVRRFTSLVTLALVVGSSLAQGGGPLAMGAQPALAAGHKYYVGSCHAGGLPDLYAAVTAVNGLPASDHKTVIVCPGTHTVTLGGGALNFQTSNLRIVGKKGAIVTTDPNYSGSTFNMSAGNRVSIQGLVIMPGPGYGGDLVVFSSVTNARIQKVGIDGGGDVDASSVGILFLNAGGIIAKNKVLNWHTSVYDGTSNTIVFEARGSGNTVRITGNTIDSFEDTAIWAHDLAKVIISGNRINSPTPAGIIAILIGLLTNGRVTGNRVTGGAFPATNNTVGIQVDQASNVRVNGNRLAHWDTGIQGLAGCAPNTANNLSIRGNQIQEVTQTGIDVQTLGAGCDTFADNLIVSGNRMKNSVAAGQVAVNLESGTDGTHFGYARNIRIKGNKATNFPGGYLPLSLNPPYVTGVIGPNL